MNDVAYPLFCVACVALVGVLHLWLRRRHRHRSSPFVWVILAVVLVAGFFVVRSAGNREREKLGETLSFLAPTYAAEIELLHHDRLSADTPPDDPIYLAIVEAQKRWLKLNPAVIDIYTWGRTGDNEIVLLADSESDIDRNGKFQGEREQRTSIGKPYTGANEDLERAFKGQTLIDPEVYKDKSGSGISAYAPLRDATGKVTGVLGLDYDAVTWNAAVSAARWQWIGWFALLVAIGAGIWVATSTHSLSVLQAAASASERRFEAYFDSLPYECWAMDENGRFWLFNRFARTARGGDYLGKTLAECAGQTAPETLVVWETHCRRALAGESVEYSYRSVDQGRTRHFHGVIAPVRSGDKIVGLIGTNLDVSARFEADAARRASEDSLALHMRQTPLGFVEWDLNFSVKKWNPAIEAIFNLPSDETIGQNGFDLLFDLNERSGAETRWRELLLGRGQRHAEHMHTRRDGQRRLCEWHHTPLADPEGKVIGLASFVQDISARAELETQLRHVQRLDSMGQLASGLAQELNRLFTPAIIHVDLLENAHREVYGMLEQVKPIREAFTQAIALSQRILTLGRTGEVEPTTWQALNPHVQDTVDLIRRTLDPRLRVIVLLAPDLPPLPLLTPVVTEIVINLLSNARDAILSKFANPPSDWKPLIRVSTSTPMAAPRSPVGKSASAPESCQCIEVSDTGCGMTEATRQRLFEPFFTTKAPGQGTGLGLAIARKAAKSLGGWIEFDSTAGEGTTFRVYLPSPRQPDATLRPAISAELLTGPGRHILLAEDDEMVSRALTLGMRRAGHLVTCANDGASALALIRLEPSAYDLVVTDLNMPNLGGRDLLAALARDTISTPVIVLSGHITSAILDELRHLGAADVLRKPIRIGELLAVIGRHATQRNTGELV